VCKKKGIRVAIGKESNLLERKLRGENQGAASDGPGRAPLERKGEAERTAWFQRRAL